MMIEEDRKWLINYLREEMKYTFLAGIVSSVNYPNWYRSNQLRRETLRGDSPEEGSTLTLQFLAFDTEPKYDFMTIKDGDGTVLLNPTSGDSLPPTILSKTNLVYLEFNSDGNTEKSGWSVEWFENLPKI